VHLSVLVLGAAVVRVAVVPAEVCPPVSADQVAASISSAAEWLERGVQPDGRYLYGYHRDTGVVSAEYNEVRHAGIVMVLYQVYAATHSPEALPAADAGLQRALGHLIEHDGWTAWAPPGEVTSGGNALLLAGMVYRREATGDTRYDGVMRGIGRFLVTMQFADGSVSSDWHADFGPIAAYSLYSTGETAWALALVDRVFPGEGWGEAAVRTIDYMATKRDRVEGRLSRLPDHWAAHALADLRPGLLTDSRIEYARRLAGYFSIRLRFESQRLGSGINLLVRWYPGTPAGFGTAGEGMGALRSLADSDARLSDLVGDMGDRIACASALMVGRQVTPDEAAAAAHPELEEGAWFYRGYTQMDDQQHTITSLLEALPVLRAQESEG
jgi:hypothetical protein